MHRHYSHAFVVTTLASALSALFSNASHGAAFALRETNASGLGNAYAGSAAAAQDASIVYDNPAGMSLIKKPQVVLAGEFIHVGTEFQDKGSRPAALQPLNRSSNGEGSTDNFIPNTYFVMPLNEQWRFGLGINAPFGLKTDYDNGWTGRFHATLSDVKSININPAISWQANEQFSLGFGLSYQMFQAEFQNRVNAGGAAAGAAQSAAQAGRLPAAAIPGIIQAVTGLEAGAKIKGDDNGWGWNIGGLWNIAPETRMGVAYRSRIKYQITGDVSFDTSALTSTNPAAAQVLAGVRQALADGPVSLDVELPSTLNLSIFHKLNPQWDVLADVIWTEWSTIQELDFRRSNGTRLQKDDYRWRDAWRLGIGTNYHWNEQTTLRFGFAYDQTPARDETRSPRLPDNDRYWFSTGIRYQLNTAMTLDAGYAYLHSPKPSINRTEDPNGRGVLTGEYKNAVHILGAQLSYSF